MTCEFWAIMGLKMGSVWFFLVWVFATWVWEMVMGFLGGVVIGARDLQVGLWIFDIEVI